MTLRTRILLIDDDAVDRQAVRRTLRASDLTWELVEAANGTEGLALARTGVFDCVLLDYRLPDVDAFDLLAELISPAGGEQTVLMLTGEPDPQTAFDLMKSGALDHLAKADLSSAGLARAIRYAMARRSFLSELGAAKRMAEEKSAALDKLNREKALLISVIAHDLRNPFQLVFSATHLLRKAIEEGDAALLGMLGQSLHQAADQAHRLMEDLFRWAAAQMDSAEVAFEAIGLDGLIETAIEACRDQAEHKGIRLEVESGGLAVRSHREMLTAILRNLVSNAIKFTPEGGSVRILAHRDGGAIELRVVDTGIGMPPEVLRGLFRLERRVTTLGTAGEKGSGIGLLLCRDLAERLQAPLSAESRPGSGTTFSLRLTEA